MPPIRVLRQPTRRVQLRPSRTELTEVLDVVGLRCRVSLNLEISVGQPTEAVSFVVDSGASYSMIGTDFARAHRIPVPPPESEIELSLQTATGLASIRVRPGRIRAWINDDLKGYPFDWPVLFRVGGPLGVPPILGLGGVVKTCRWAFDGSDSIESPYGYLTLEDIR